MSQERLFNVLFELGYGFQKLEIGELKMIMGS